MAAAVGLGLSSGLSSDKEAYLRQRKRQTFALPNERTNFRQDGLRRGLVGVALRELAMISSNSEIMRCRTIDRPSSQDRASNRLRLCAMLNKFGNNFPAGDDVGHAEIFHPNE